ncbi:hypothetical protein [Butyricicoccus sp.]|uniref:hypothetical protein n=1 Tax=Butyricicoccus sp. TaxID=2049021 RepID=UPI003F156B75
MQLRTVKLVLPLTRFILQLDFLKIKSNRRSFPMPEKTGLTHGKSNKTPISVDCFANNRFFISENEQKAEGEKENFSTIAQIVAGQ